MPPDREALERVHSAFTGRIDTQGPLSILGCERPSHEVRGPDPVLPTGTSPLEQPVLRPGYVRTEVTRSREDYALPSEGQYSRKAYLFFVGNDAPRAPFIGDDAWSRGGCRDPYACRACHLSSRKRYPSFNPRPRGPGTIDNALLILGHGIDQLGGARGESKSSRPPGTELPSLPGVGFGGAPGRTRAHGHHDSPRLVASAR